MIFWHLSKILNGLQLQKCEFVRVLKKLMYIQLALADQKNTFEMLNKRY